MGYPFETLDTLIPAIVIIVSLIVILATRWVDF